MIVYVVHTYFRYSDIPQFAGVFKSHGMAQGFLKTNGLIGSITPTKLISEDI